MQPIRIKACSESDLRMLGNLARNIQRVLPVTQADIDAAAALGKGWVVWKVFEVTDPLDNLRGGTQLVIKQNSIQPGQNVRRVLIVQDPASKTVVILGTDYIVLPDAIFNSLQYVKAFGGTEQGGVPYGYTLLNGVTNGSSTYIDTGITPNVDDVEVEIKVKPSAGSWYILQSRDSVIWGISGSMVGPTILLGWGGTSSLCQSAITRNTTHTYYVKATMKNGNATLYVKDETAGTEDTQTNTYTSAVPSLPFWLYGNQNNDMVNAGNTVYMARIKVGGVTVMDYVPALNPSMVVGFYDKATGYFKVSNEGTLTADQTIVPTPDAPMDIVSNNGVLAFRDTELPIGYRRLKDVIFDGETYYVTDVYLTGADTTSFVMNAAESGRNALGCYTGDASGDNVSFYVATGGSGNYVRYRDILYRPTISTAKLNTDLPLSIGPTGTTGFDTDATWEELEFTCPDEFYIGWLANASSPKFIGSFKGEITISNRAALIPCERTSDGAIGYYNINSNVFFENQGTGTPTTSGYDYTHCAVLTNGTVETINAHGKNLFNYDQDVSVESVSSNGIWQRYNVLIDLSVGNWYAKKITNVNAGTYIASVYTSSGLVTFGNIFVYDGTQTTKYSSGSVITLTKPSEIWFMGGSSSTWNTITKAQFERGSTVTDWEQYYNGGTATAEMLLKVGDYQDEQEILSGAVTRNVGVLVLDGTEEIWGSTSQTPDYVSVLTNCYTIAIPLGDGAIGKRRVYCTHLNSSDTLQDANARQGYALLGNGGSATPEPLTNKYAVGLGLTTSFPTIAGLKQWLAGQYAAGTPVIIVYPLKTPTTESVTGQTLQVQVGDNIVEITQASLNRLELEAQYQAAVSLTIQEVQDANLDPNVEVTIN